MLPQFFSVSLRMREETMRKTLKIGPDDFVLTELADALLVQGRGVTAAFTRKRLASDERASGPVQETRGAAVAENAEEERQRQEDAGNLSFTVGDDPACVRRNRDWALSLLGLSACPQVWGEQVHGARVFVVGQSSFLDEDSSGGATSESVCSQDLLVPGTDALVTGLSLVALGILTADCVPILLVGEDAMAIVHAGWRGLLAGVIGAAVAALQQASSGSGADRIIAFVGPSIGACCFEVGPEVADMMEQAFPSPHQAVVHHMKRNRPYVDLRNCVHVALSVAGVLFVQPLFPCTRCDNGFFSHRRGDRGRQALVAARSSSEIFPRISPGLF